MDEIKDDGAAPIRCIKGTRKLRRSPWRRGGVASRRSINQEHDCLLAARDGTGHNCSFRTGRVLVNAYQLHACLPSILPADVLLISDAANVDAVSRA
jgi:hypothetical protein